LFCIGVLSCWDVDVLVLDGCEPAAKVHVCLICCEISHNLKAEAVLEDAATRCLWIYPVVATCLLGQPEASKTLLDDKVGLLVLLSKLIEVHIHLRCHASEAAAPCCLCQHGVDLVLMRRRVLEGLGETLTHVIVNANAAKGAWLDICLFCHGVVKVAPPAEEFAVAIPQP